MNTLKHNERILSFDSFVSSNSIYVSRALNECEYVGVAEALLDIDGFVFEDEQRVILEFIAHRKLNPNDWYLLMVNEGWFDDATKWFNEKIIKPTSSAIKGAINWAVELGSSIWEAIRGVVQKIMDSFQDAWDLVKIETQKWYGGNKSLKRQMTMEINASVASLKESLSNPDQVVLTEKAIAAVTKEVGQLSSMFVQTVRTVIGGDVFASKVTQSLKKSVNESKDTEIESVERQLQVLVMKMVPDALHEGHLNVKKLMKVRSRGVITSFSEMHTINEGIEIVDKFYEYAFKILDALPPFSWIKDYIEEVKKNPNEVLNSLSKFLTEQFGVPGPYTFDVLGGVFEIVITAAIDFAKYYLIDCVIAQVANFIIPGSGAVIMWLLMIYAVYIVGEAAYTVVIQNSGGEAATSEN